MSIQQPAFEGRGPKRVPDVWGSQIPQRSVNFTGRDDLLERLRAGIGKDVTAVVPQALQGLGGVGKTLLAVEYAYRYREEYDLVWWITADQPVLVRSSLAQLAPALGLPPFTLTGMEDASRAVLDALRRGEPYSRWLLIFDNADQPEDLIEILPHGPGHVLITSRNHRWEGFVGTLRVDVFKREESVSFLRKRTRQRITEADADRLADALGDLPLALEQAGALLAETGETVPEYLRDLERHTRAVLDEGKPPEYPVSMSAAWALSVASVNQRLPEAVSVLRYCAFFSPEPIPRRVFSEAKPGQVPELDNLIGRPMPLNKVVWELGRYALLRVDAGNSTIQVHRLIQALVRDELSPEEQNRIRHEVNLLLAAALPDNPEDPDNWRKYAELVGHVSPAGVVETDDPALRRMALNMARYLQLSGQLPAARAFVESLLSSWGKAAPGEELDVLLASRQLGLVLREQGEYAAAFELNQKTLDRMRELSGQAAEEATLIQVNSVGADLRASGDFKAARTHDELSVAQHETVLGPDDPRTLRALNNLALDLGLVSEYEAARDMHELAYQRQVASGADVGVTTLLNIVLGLSRALRLCGDFRTACELGDDAYAMATRELTADHPSTLVAGAELSIARRRAADYEVALDLAEFAHSRLRRLYGTDSPSTMGAAICLANILRTIGREEDALGLAEETARLYPGIYGPEHPYYFGCLGNVALIRRTLGDPAEARRLNEEALRGLEAKLSRDHHYSLVVAANLASDLAELGELESAIRLGTGTLRRMRTLLGDDHPTTLAVAANLSIDLEAGETAAEGEALYADTVERYQRTLGLYHPDAVVAQERRHLDFDFDPPPI